MKKIHYTEYSLERLESREIPRELVEAMLNKAVELRAVMSLSQLRRKHGKKKEARQMLSEIYNWFTEERHLLPSFRITGVGLNAFVPVT
jgi:hypothetical protein